MWHFSVSRRTIRCTFILPARASGYLDRSLCKLSGHIDLHRPEAVFEGRPLLLG